MIKLPLAAHSACRACSRTRRSVTAGPFRSFQDQQMVISAMAGLDTAIRLNGPCGRVARRCTKLVIADVMLVLEWPDSGGDGHQHPVHEDKTGVRMAPVSGFRRNRPTFAPMSSYRVLSSRLWRGFSTIGAFDDSALCPSHRQRSRGWPRTHRHCNSWYLRLWWSPAGIVINPPVASLPMNLPVMQRQRHTLRLVF